MRAKSLLERWNKVNEEEAQKIGPKAQKQIEGTIKSQIAVLQSQVNNPKLSDEKKAHARKAISAFNKRLVDVKKGFQYSRDHYMKESLKEKLSKGTIDNFKTFVKTQIDFDISPYIDLEHSRRDYLNINTHKIPEIEKGRLFSLETAYGKDKIKISDNGGFGHAFHILPGFAKLHYDESLSEAEEIWKMTRKEYQSKYGKGRNNTTVTGGFCPHKEAVMTALNQGKNVPKEVLADYPEIKESLDEDTFNKGKWVSFAKETIRQDEPHLVNRLDFNSFGSLMEKVYKLSKDIESVIWTGANPQGTEDRTWVRVWAYMSGAKAEYKGILTGLDSNHANRIYGQFKSAGLKEALDETAAVVTSFADKSGKSVASVEAMWDSIKLFLIEQGHKESDSNFYAMLVGSIKNNLGIK